MAPATLSTKDRDDLEKFTKYLSYKVVQAIIQSRLGKKLRTFSKPTSDRSDWFHLAIVDLPEIQAETKKTLSGSHQQLPCLGTSLCVEISLRTFEPDGSSGDTLALETWSLGVELGTPDPSARISTCVYHRMALLLKSLLVMSRTVPAYHLACSAASASHGDPAISPFIICYRIYLGEPQVDHLGTGFSKMKVGQVVTPVGTLVLNLAYRVDLTLSPKQLIIEEPLRFHQDHYNSLSNSNEVAFEKKKGYLEFKRKGPFVPESAIKTDRYQDFLIPKLPFNPIVENDNDNNPIINYSAKDPMVGHNRVSNTCTVENAHLRDRSPDLNCNTESGKPLNQDDFILVEIRPSFANTRNDLNTFFQEFKSPPTLLTFTNQPSLGDQMSEISSQLSTFETNLQHFDNFVTTFCKGSDHPIACEH